MESDDLHTINDPHNLLGLRDSVQTGSGISKNLRVRK